MRNQNQNGWALDYDWSRRGGPWNEFTDVLLIGDPGGQAQTLAALKDWIARQEHDRAQVDGKACEIFYAGGVQGYLHSTGEDGAACVLHLHSRGEDAFDSLSHYSREIAKFVRARHADARLTWIEAGHDRPDFRLKWP